MPDRADAAWVGPVRAVLWGCKTVPCVSLCVRVFFDDDKLLSAPLVLPESSLPLPTYRLWVTVWCLGSAGLWIGLCRDWLSALHTHRVYVKNTTPGNRRR